MRGGCYFVRVPDSNQKRGGSRWAWLIVGVICLAAGGSLLIQFKAAREAGMAIWDKKQPAQTRKYADQAESYFEYAMIAFVAAGASLWKAWTAKAIDPGPYEGE